MIGGHPPPVPQRLPGTLVKAPADAELHRRHQGPLDDLVQREAQYLDHEEGLHDGHHGEHHAQQKHRQREAGAGVEELPQLVQLRLLA